MAPRSRAADVLALVPAAAIPLIFLHARYQAHGAIGAFDVYGSDVAVGCVVVAAAAAGIHFGWRPLTHAWTLWAPATALLTLFVVSCFWRPVEDATTHLVTAAKIWEYALLAPATCLLLRNRRQVERFLWAFVAWGVAAAGWGLLQFVGAVNEFEGKRPGQREVSFLGIYDFAVFAGAVLAIGLAAIALGRGGPLGRIALVAGAGGAILAASVFAYGGIVLAALAAALVGRRNRALTRRRLLALAATVVVVGAGVLSLRSYDLSNFFSFLGIKATTTASSETVQTSRQRAMLSYIGLRIWEDHPLLGVGFERSSDRYGPYLAAAKRKFPDQPAYAYPSPAHPWGVQNFWVQLLADTGIVGFVLAVGTFLAGLVPALRAPPATRLVGLVAAGWIFVAAGTWIGEGIVAGIPLQAVTWLGLGLSTTLTALE